MIRLYVVKPIKHIFQAELEIWFKLVKPLVLLFEQIKLINVFINFITNFDFQSKLVAPGGARASASFACKTIPPLAALAVNCFRDKHCLELKWWYIPPFCLQNCFRDELVLCLYVCSFISIRIGGVGVWGSSFNCIEFGHFLIDFIQIPNRLYLCFYRGDG